MAANSSPSLDFVVSSIEKLRKGEILQCPRSDNLIPPKESNPGEEDKTNIELNRLTARPTTPIT